VYRIIPRQSQHVNDSLTKNSAYGNNLALILIAKEYRKKGKTGSDFLRKLRTSILRTPDSYCINKKVEIHLEQCQKYEFQGRGE
jgi:hypothetical protein